MAALLQIENLQIRAGEKELLFLPALSLERGKAYGIIGESGSGKSLSLLSLMGLLPKGVSTSGRAIWNLNGKDLFAMRQTELRSLRNKEIGMVFQEPLSALNPQMTCGDQLSEAILVHEKCNKSQLKLRMEEALKSVGLLETERFIESFPHQISGGQRQRVMIAMATVHKPALLLADEPTTALDPDTGREVLDMLLARCREMGTTLLLVSHDLEIVERYCNHVTVLRKSVCLDSGGAEEVLRTKPHPYVAELWDSIPSGKRTTPVGEPVFTVKDVSKTYLGRRGRKQVLNDVGFSLKRGETLAVLGPSGAGKSTLAKILTGLEKSENGEVYFHGENILNKKVTGVQMVFQDPFASLNMNLKNLETVAEVLRVNGLPREDANRKGLQLLADVGLGQNQANQYPAQLSGGQRQRLCIARALASEPEVLVLDEAVAALDPLIQHQVLDLLAGLQDKTGMIYIFITHNPHIAESFCHKILHVGSGFNV